MSHEPVIRAAGDGERRWFFGGGVHTWKVEPDEGGGAFAMFEDELTAGKSTPWHCHPDSEELMYLLEGEVDVDIAGRRAHLTAGATWQVPRGVPHAFVVTSPTARLLALQSPATAGQFYRQASEPAAAEPGQVDFARIGAVAAETGITTILGPPPFAPT